MPSTQEFRHRIKSANNTKQITKAMEMVSSVKMQKAIRTIHQARIYVQSSWNMLVHLANLTLPKNHRLLQANESGKTAIIFITSNRGLCGAYNSDLFKKLLSFIKKEQKFKSETPDIIAIGKTGADFVSKINAGNLIAAFDGFESDIQYEEIIPISKMTNGEYLKGNYSKVVVIYSHFASSLKQIPVVKQILPIDQDHIDLPEAWETQNTKKDIIEYKIEPNPDAVLDKLLYRFIRLQVFGAVLESNASEHSSRMVAMKNATDNAGNLINDLTLMYNTIRQNNITSEIAEISGAAEAMKQQN